jgi:hypothetical protein
MLGRWVESRSQPTHPAGQVDGGGPLSQVLTPVDAEDDLSYFDELEGGEREPEPTREIATNSLSTGAKPAVRSADPALAPPSGDVDGEDGSYYIQVFAGRDRASIEELVGQLEDSGYRVRVFTEREGRGSLFKLRVGGYPTDERAREVTATLRQNGFPGAWVFHSE